MYKKIGKIGHISNTPIGTGGGLESVIYCYLTDGCQSTTRSPLMNFIQATSIDAFTTTKNAGILINTTFVSDGKRIPSSALA